MSEREPIVIEVRGKPKFFPSWHAELLQSDQPVYQTDLASELADGQPDNTVGVILYSGNPEKLLADLGKLWARRERVWLNYDSEDGGKLSSRIVAAQPPTDRRQRLVRNSGAVILWVSVPTEPGAIIDISPYGNLL